jgi:signal transduction histidine kinase
MRLSDFIRSHTALIISEWESFAQTLLPAAEDMSPLTLRNHISQILAFIVDDIESSQSGPEQIQKSHGEGPKEIAEIKTGNSVAEAHAALRLAGGFNMDQMVSEYRALRASVIKLWSAERTEMRGSDVMDLTRFNESIDQALTESICYYTKKVAHSRDLFLGILSHDLRNPLGAILASAELTLRIGALNDRQTMLLSQIVDSTQRVNEIVDHLLDLTRSRLGSGLPIIKGHMDFGFVSRQMTDEMRAAHPKRDITLEVTGKLEGEWDKARIGQVFSNLIGNAIQYSFRDTPIDVRIMGEDNGVMLSVHNQGNSIQPAKLAGIFDALTRSVGQDGQEVEGSVNLGLGLYITKEIVVAHGGSINVTSTEKGGTTFTASFPRA